MKEVKLSAVMLQSAGCHGSQDLCCLCVWPESLHARRALHLGGSQLKPLTGALLIDAACDLGYHRPVGCL
eukprot:SAG11_NODE_2535_length_3245_cov_11.597584_2_plen_70_part_00